MANDCQVTYPSKQGNDRHLRQTFVTPESATAYSLSSKRMNLMTEPVILTVNQNLRTQKWESTAERVCIAPRPIWNSGTASPLYLSHIRSGSLPEEIISVSNTNRTLCLHLAVLTGSTLSHHDTILLRGRAVPGRLRIDVLL